MEKSATTGILGMNDFVSECIAALDAGTTYPTFSKTGGDLASAYEVQRELTAELSKRTACIGYKAALTNPAAQQAMGIESPIVGMLFEQTDLSALDVVQINSGILEVELGYVLDESPQQAVSAQTLPPMIRSIHAMVEIAKPNLATKPSAEDLVATNSATFGLIKGPELNLQTSRLNDVDAAMQQAETTLYSGSAAEVMQGQLPALAWLINNALSLGYTIEPGHLLMTGSIGGVAPTNPGQYCGAFTLAEKPLAEVKFEITAD